MINPMLLASCAYVTREFVVLLSKGSHSFFPKKEAILVKTAQGKDINSPNNTGSGFNALRFSIRHLTQSNFSSNWRFVASNSF